VWRYAVKKNGPVKTRESEQIAALLMRSSTRQWNATIQVFEDTNDDLRTKIRAASFGQK
jgi:hypothetical protein